MNIPISQQVAAASMQAAALGRLRFEVSKDVYLMLLDRKLEWLEVGERELEVENVRLAKAAVALADELVRELMHPPAKP